jgi:molybdenum cofactor biosynthesis protein B
VSDHRVFNPGDVACFVLTVSDTRTPATDSSGRAIVSALEEAGHAVTGHKIVRDEPDEVTGAIRQELREGHARVIITTGGTGISRRDSTYEALSTMFEKQLDGFGELFRMLSFQEIGAPAMLSRATAGVVSGRAMFLLPGSEAAVRLAMTRL